MAVESVIVDNGSESAIANNFSESAPHAKITIKVPPQPPWTPKTLPTHAKLLAALNDSLSCEDYQNARTLYTQLLAYTPHSPTLLLAWMQMEWRRGECAWLEALFEYAFVGGRGSFDQWMLYLQYILDSCPISSSSSHGDGGGIDNRETIIKAYELVIGSVGLDVRALPLYQGYISFLTHSGPSPAASHPPGNTTTTTYQQQLQMEQIRKVYHRALLVPLWGIERLWSEYAEYEHALNKMTAKKMLADKSAGYMRVRMAVGELANIFGVDSGHINDLLEPNPTNNHVYSPSSLSFSPNLSHALTHTSIKDKRQSFEQPIMPAPSPLDNCDDGSSSLKWFHRAYAFYREWWRWEQGNPLQIPPNAAMLKSRLRYAYGQAGSVLGVLPEYWCQVATMMTENDISPFNPTTLTAAPPSNPNKNTLKSDGAIELLRDCRRWMRIEPLPAFKLVELLRSKDDEEGQEECNAVFDDLIGAQTEALLELAKEHQESMQSGPDQNKDADEDKADGALVSSTQAHWRQMLTLSMIQQMKHTRQTKGINAARHTFTRARKHKPAPTLALYTASALMEYYCKRDAKIACKVFELGMQVGEGEDYNSTDNDHSHHQFREREQFHLEYLGWLLESRDWQNAELLFERLVKQYSSFPVANGAGDDHETIASRGQSIWRLYMQWQWEWGDIEKSKKLMQRFRDHWGNNASVDGLAFDDDDLALFTRWWSWSGVGGVGGGGELQPVGDRIWSLLSAGVHEEVGAAEDPGQDCNRQGAATPFYIPNNIMALATALKHTINNNPSSESRDALLSPGAIVQLCNHLSNSSPSSKIHTLKSSASATNKRRPPPSHTRLPFIAKKPAKHTKRHHRRTFGTDHDDNNDDAEAHNIANSGLPPANDIFAERRRVKRI